ncbi:MAG: HupE/UreJ family protein [Verrucomicrobiota bacterium JB022]|nr:HupE/UreJ family protein [Verrucomicrobiota bacterium JB022]
MTLRNTLSRSSLAVAALTLPVIAYAHPGHSHGLHGFEAGFMHPVMGLDHLLGLLALGLVSARFRGAQAATYGGVIAASLAVGLLVGRLVGGFSGLEYALSASLALVAVPLLWQRAGNLAAASAIAAVVAGVHAMAHGIELHGTVALLGFVLSSVAIVAAGHGVGRVLARQPLAQAVFGCIVAAFGVWSLLGA